MHTLVLSFCKCFFCFSLHSFVTFAFKSVSYACWVFFFMMSRVHRRTVKNAVYLPLVLHLVFCIYIFSLSLPFPLSAAFIIRVEMLHNHFEYNKSCFGPAIVVRKPKKEEKKCAPNIQRGLAYNKRIDWVCVYSSTHVSRKKICFGAVSNQLAKRALARARKATSKQTKRARQQWKMNKINAKRTTTEKNEIIAESNEIILARDWVSRWRESDGSEWRWIRVRLRQMRKTIGTHIHQKASKQQQNITKCEREKSQQLEPNGKKQTNKSFRVAN